MLSQFFLIYSQSKLCLYICINSNSIIMSDKEIALELTKLDVILSAISAKHMITHTCDGTLLDAKTIFNKHLNQDKPQE
ncbi:hypothetical protein [Zunongwangia sp. SCSIO 43204]|uniref:hypothetical protein n=1 Tax=Zunongwangia sp. SCSIO 43204 TaxID=2779359 RepID=UPI00351CF456